MNNINFIKLIFILAISVSLFLSFQSNIQYNELMIFFNDPLNSMPNVALKYASKSLIEYFNAKGIKAYAEYPYSVEAAFKLAKERDLNFLLEIRSNVSGISRSSSGYSVKLETIASTYLLNDQVAKFSGVDTGFSENALSSDIAYAYALYDGAIKAISKIEKDLLLLLKK